MAIHWIRIIESGHMSTQRLFELGLAFNVCKRKGRWPSLETMNSFLKGGRDDGELATDIEWEPCELSQPEYLAAIASVMKEAPFEVDSRTLEWEVWMADIRDEKA